MYTIITIQYTRFLYALTSKHIGNVFWGAILSDLRRNSPHFPLYPQTNSAHTAAEHENVRQIFVQHTYPHVVYVRKTDICENNVYLVG